MAEPEEQHEVEAAAAAEPAPEVPEKPAAPSLQFPSFGSWGSFANTVTAGLTSTLEVLKETASKTVKSLEEEAEKRLSEFEKDRQDFVRQKREAHEYFIDEFPDAEPVWVDGSGNEDELRKQVLGLSSDKRNFLVEPPPGTDFEFDLKAILPSAMATLRADPALEKMRFALVPTRVKEQLFWSNYFYRVGLIKQALALSTKLDEATAAGDSGADEAFGTGTDGIPEDLAAEFGTGTDDDMGAALGDGSKGPEEAGDAWEAELQDLLKA